jgi:hypothetical protein
MKITEEQYLEALALLNKTEEAKQMIEQFEEQQRYADNPELEIMEKGKVEFVAGEVIRENPMLWRATHLRYVHEKGTVERIISYANDGMSKDMLVTKKDKITLI